MKKFLAILTASVLLLCGVVLTGCAAAETIKESVESSYKQWYKYDKGNKQVNIPVVNSLEDDTETAAESDVKLQNADVYFYFDPDAGLTVAVQVVTSQNVEVLGGLVNNRMDLVTGSTNTYPLNKFGKGKWAALWGSGKIKKDSAPKIYTNPTECINLNTENGKKIQWKKFLANYLLNSLLDD